MQLKPFIYCKLLCYIDPSKYQKAYFANSATKAELNDYVQGETQTYRKVRGMCRENI